MSSIAMAKTLVATVVVLFLLLQLCTRVVSGACTDNQLSVECHQDSLGQLNVTVTCVVNQTSFISTARVELCTTGKMKNDNKSLPACHLCPQFHELCTAVDCTALCNQTLTGILTVCNQCTKQSAHCSVAPSRTISSRSHTTGSYNGTNNSNNSGNVRVTNGSTAVIVLLCILGLVCLAGTCARHKHRRWHSSGRVRSSSAQDDSARDTELSNREIEPVRITPPPPHYQFCQTRPVNTHHHTANHSIDKDTVLQESSLQQPPPPAYETLDHAVPQLSTNTNDNEPPPPYSSVITERTSVEQDDSSSCSINYSDIENV